MAGSRETPEHLARRLSEIRISERVNPQFGNNNHYNHSAGSNFNSDIAARESYQFGNVAGNVNIAPQATKFSGVYSKTPLRPVLDFVRRPTQHNLIKEQLHKTLAERNDTSKILVVFGLGGAGKSQLTLNYIRTYQDDYTGVFWIEAGQKESIEREFLAIYSHLFPGHENAAVDIAITKVKNWFHGQDGRWLFIFDSADTIDHEEDDSYINLSTYIPDAASVDIIITTRSSEAKAMTMLQPIEVAELELKQAVELLCKCSKLINPSEEVVTDIVKELGCLALAISLAGAYISETPRLKNDIQKYLPEYRERRDKLLSREPKRLIHYYGKSVLTTWESSFRAICQKSPEASQLLGLLAFLNPDDILTIIFQLEQDDWQSQLFPNRKLDKYDFEEAFRILQTYSLVQYKDDKETYYMHRLVHTWAYARLEDDQKQILCYTSLWLLIEISYFPGLSPMLKSRLVPHIMASYNLSVKIYKIRSTERWETLNMLSWLSSFLDSIGQWSAGLQIRTFCYKELQLLAGQEHPHTLTSMSNLASTYISQGRWEEAEELEVQVIEATKRVLGQEHPDTLTSMSILASTYISQGRWEEAEELEVQVIEARKRVLGQEHPDTLTSMSILALTYNNQGRWKEAEELGVQVIEARKRVLGQEHPYTLTSMSNLALVWKMQGRNNEASDLMIKVVQLRTKKLGADHHDTKASANTLEKWGGERKETEDHSASSSVSMVSNPENEDHE